MKELGRWPLPLDQVLFHLSQGVGLFVVFGAKGQMEQGSFVREEEQFPVGFGRLQ